jgi:hypothetical protein
MSIAQAYQIILDSSVAFLFKSDEHKIDGDNHNTKFSRKRVKNQSESKLLELDKTK